MNDSFWHTLTVVIIALAMLATCEGISCVLDAPCVGWLTQDTRDR